MTCDQLSVKSWLDNLRYTTENYDPGVPTVDFDLESDALSKQTVGIDNTVKVNRKQIKHTDRENIGSSSDDDNKVDMVEMDSESENLKRLSVLSGSYENIWNCSTKIRDESDLKYGNVCRISVEFDEIVQELCLSPMVLTRFDFSIPTDILQWKSDLLLDCSSEDEDQVNVKRKN